MILRKQRALGLAQAWLEQIQGGKETRKSTRAGRIMPDSQIQARGFVDLEAEATDDFFLLLILYLNTYASESWTDVRPRLLVTDFSLQDSPMRSVQFSLQYQILAVAERGGTK